MSPVLRSNSFRSELNKSGSSGVGWALNATHCPSPETWNPPTW